FDVADPSRAQYRNDIGGDLLPVALDLFLNVQFENGQTVLNRKRIRGLDLKQFDIQIERICQAVSGINAHDQGAVAQLGESHACCRSEARFAYAAFAAEQQNPHTLIVREEPAGLSSHFTSLRVFVDLPRVTYGSLFRAELGSTHRLRLARG